MMSVVNIIHNFGCHHIPASCGAILLFRTRQLCAEKYWFAHNFLIPKNAFKTRFLTWNTRFWWNSGKVLGTLNMKQHDRIFFFGYTFSATVCRIVMYVYRFNDIRKIVSVLAFHWAVFVNLFAFLYIWRFRRCKKSACTLQLVDTRESLLGFAIFFPCPSPTWQLIWIVDQCLTETFVVK